MSESVLLDTALCLPASDIETLVQGQMIAVIPGRFINPGRQFALYPVHGSINLQSYQQYYRSSFLPSVAAAVTKLNSDKILIKAWARCELCKMQTVEFFDAISKLTVWTQEALYYELGQRNHIFLAYLRVYLLLNPIEISVQSQNRHFLPLRPSIHVSEATPVLTDSIFSQRKRQLENLEPPLYPELEKLQGALASLSFTNPTAKELDDDIKVFLGWSSDKSIKQQNSDLAWINDIAKLGDRSIEQDEGKSNYQAGTDFEDIARKSLNFLGFKVEEDYKGGAGGLDLFCSQPYPLVCECKAGKSIPDRAVEELDRIGKRHLKENYLQAVRLIIGPGKPTKNIKESAEISKISIINVMTLQKLVEFKAKYPGAINLVELRKYLEHGQIDYKIDEYIDKIEQNIKLRSQIIKVVKELSEQDNQISQATHPCFTVTEIRVHYNATHNPKQTDDQVCELLIELSSPLTGYLGREKGDNWRSDRFYYLRDLPI